MSIFYPVGQYFGNLGRALFGGANTLQPGLQNSGGSPASGAGHVVSATTALQLSAVWACTRIVSEAVGAMPVKVWNVEPDGTRTPNTTHWIYRLLNGSPNRYQTRNEFFETLAINLMISGNSYGRYPSRKSDGSIVSIMMLPASQIEVKLDKSGDRTYRFTSGGVETEVYNQTEIWHVPLMPSNGIVGLSPLQYGARSMGIAMGNEDRVATLAANGFKSSGVLTIDKVLKPDQRAAIRENFQGVQSGQGDTLQVLEAGMKFEQVSMNPKDVQLLESRRFQVEDIARFYGVPSVLINDTTGTTGWGTGISEIKEGFYTLTLQPLLEKLESSICRWLLMPEERGKIAVEFDVSAFLRGSEAQQITTLAAAISGKVYTINEARLRKGLPPIANGDVMYDQSQMIPIGSEAEQNDETIPPPN